jgi:hypothetical protein
MEERSNAPRGSKQAPTLRTQRLRGELDGGAVRVWDGWKREVLSDRVGAFGRLAAPRLRSGQALAPRQGRGRQDD